jgi:predicted O-methyltransferase YrrM
LGVAAGWSTIAMGLINPNSKLYAIDNCSEGQEAEKGIRITNKIAKKLNLDLSIFIGSSPNDVPKFLNNVLHREKIDFALID